MGENMNVELAPELYRDVAVFEKLGDDEIALMLEGSTRLEIAEGAAVFREGEPVDAFFILESGKCAVRKRSQNGGEIDLATLVPKAAFGEMGLIGARPRIASIVALEPSVVRRITRERFDALIAKGEQAVTKVALNMARILSDRLAALNEQFTRLMDKAGGQGAQKKKVPTVELQAFKEQLYKEWSF